MKKPLKLIMLAAVVITTTAQEQLPPIDDATVKGFIRDCSDGHLDDGIPPIMNRTEDLLLRYDISKERIAKILEEMIREELPVVEAKPLERDDFVFDAIYLNNYINDLAIFHNANTLALLKECVMSKDSGVRFAAVRAYVSIAGAESIPFVREFLAGDRLSVGVRYSLVEEFLPKIYLRLRAENKTADAEKFMELLKEFGIPEPQEPPKVEEPTHSITTPPNPEPTPLTIIDEAEQPIQKIPPEQPEKPSTTKTFLWLSVIALLAIIGGGVVWWKKR